MFYKDRYIQHLEDRIKAQDNQIDALNVRVGELVDRLVYSQTPTRITEQKVEQRAVQAETDKNVAERNKRPVDAVSMLHDKAWERIQKQQNKVSS